MSLVKDDGRIVVEVGIIHGFMKKHTIRHVLEEGSGSRNSSAHHHMWMCTRWVRTRRGEAPLLHMNKGKILAENGGLGVELEPEPVCCEDDVVDGEETFGCSGNSSARCRVWRWVHEVGKDEGRWVHEVGEDEAWRGTVVAHEQGKDSC